MWGAFAYAGRRKKAAGQARKITTESIAARARKRKWRFYVDNMISFWERVLAFTIHIPHTIREAYPGRNSV